MQILEVFDCKEHHLYGTTTTTWYLDPSWATMRRPNTAGSTANSPDIVADTDEALRLVTSGSSNNVANSYETHLRKRRYVVGVCFLLLVVVLWVSSNFLTSVYMFVGSVMKWADCFRHCSTTILIQSHTSSHILIHQPSRYTFYLYPCVGFGGNAVALPC